MNGQKIGRYEIKSELGRGGMATVYLAHDPSFGRNVALKVLSRQFLHDPSFRGRFEREAKTIAALEHAAIVPVYDFGYEGEQPFLVMRHMPGGSLLDRMRAGPLPTSDVLEVLSRISSALDYAHRQRIIHRDLKPGNILFDNQGNAFLTDFGIAKLAESSSTFTGSAIIGTPAYMSPEQIHGEKDLDGRSDIYALGIILFEMLTGQSPFKADTPARLMMAHVLNPVPQLRQMKPDIPPAYDMVVSKALAKNREERYHTATSLSEELAQAATGVLAKPAALEGTIIEQHRPVTATVIESPTPAPARPATEIAAPPAAAPRRRGVPIWAWIGGGLLLLLCLALGISGAIAGGVFLTGNDRETPQATTTTLAQVSTATATTAPPTNTAEPPTNTPPPPTATPTATPTDTPVPTRVVLNFSRVEDRSGRLGLELPEQWQNETEELVVLGSPNVTVWLEGFAGEREGSVTVPGLFLFVFEDLEDGQSVDGAFIDTFLESYTWPDNCQGDINNQNDYDDGLFVGVILAAPCDQGEYTLLLAYDPENPVYALWLEAYVLSEEDGEVLARALDTFTVEAPVVVNPPTAVPTQPPAASPTPIPPNVRNSLLTQMRSTRGDMENMGGMIDSAVNSGFIDCSDVVTVYDRVANAPSFNVAGSGADVQSAHEQYRQSVARFTNGVRDLAENCRTILGTGSGTIPFSQWGPARTAVNESLDILNPAIQSLE
ncbi:MAG: serine/threonine protein kinase [Chloroflexi bacterium]|nr:serine/threonine protein kinase [Chloroflexota bacterium]MCI0576219.1 serine/threonine protein kinase [Chloroflexota bacterium]MCI0645487.1 serine/threonine protein kinase [Chloroflexota bacterium]MCI0730626.1 serine/threonine protein kinase [Chloroflexota bacterium]